MKDSFNNNILNLYKNEEKFLINSNHQINNIITNFTINNYFKNLEETRNIELSIIHSKISFKEKINYSSFEKSELFLKIKDIIKKYKNFPLININHLQNICTVYLKSLKDSYRDTVLLCCNKDSCAFEHNCIHILYFLILRYSD